MGHLLMTRTASRAIRLGVTGWHLHQSHKKIKERAIIRPPLCYWKSASALTTTENFLDQAPRDKSLSLVDGCSGSISSFPDV